MGYREECDGEEMKWFKHYTNSPRDSKLTQLSSIEGNRGYAIWWRLLEVVAGEDSEDCRETHPIEVWSRFLWEPVDDVKRIFDLINRLELAQVTTSPDGLITVLIPKLAELHDTYTARKTSKGKKNTSNLNDIKEPCDSVRTVFEQCSKNVPSRIEENRREENTTTPPPQEEDPEAFMSLWNDFAKKNGISQCSVMNKSRKSRFYLRKKEGLMQDLPKVFAGIESSDFLLGKKKSEGKHVNWRLDIDFVLANDTNWVKIKEGKYSDGPRLAPGCLAPADDYDEGDVQELPSFALGGGTYYAVANKDNGGYEGNVWKDYIPHKKGQPLYKHQRVDYRGCVNDLTF